MSETELVVRQDAGAVTFAVRVQPRAKRDRIVGVHDGALKIALTAPPVEGAANEALVKLVAGALGVSRRDVTILHGDSSRQKSLRVAGTTADAVRALVPKSP